VIRVLAGVLCLGMLTIGCGGDPPLPDRLRGRAVAAMAERQLEAQNSRLAPGTLSCPDVAMKVGASVRCLRTTELSDGRLVKIGGTVSVTSLASGGRLHVAMDRQPQEFGLLGERVAAGVREWYAKHFGAAPAGLACPYLRGEVGNRVVCHGAGRDIEVVVTGVDPGSYRAVYVIRAHRPRPTP
jgi:hypothetical protein